MCGTFFRGLGVVKRNINVDSFDITVICFKLKYVYFLISTEL
jgi:hypothetical protein